MFLGAQKNRPIETVLLSTHIICFGWEIKKIVFQYALLSGGLNYPPPPTHTHQIDTAIDVNDTENFIFHFSAGRCWYLGSWYLHLGLRLWGQAAVVSVGEWSVSNSRLSFIIAIVVNVTENFIFHVSAGLCWYIGSWYLHLGLRLWGQAAVVSVGEWSVSNSRLCFIIAIVVNVTENVYFSCFSWPVLVYWVLVFTSWGQIMGPSSCHQCWGMICIK